jgi:hypothetical protein
LSALLGNPSNSSPPSIITCQACFSLGTPTGRPVGSLRPQESHHDASLAMGQTFGQAAWVPKKVIETTFLSTETPSGTLPGTQRMSSCHRAAPRSHRDDFLVIGRAPPLGHQNRPMQADQKQKFQKISMNRRCICTSLACLLFFSSLIIKSP